MGTVVETTTKKQLATDEDLDWQERGTLEFTTIDGIEVTVGARHVVSLTTVSTGDIDAEHRKQGGTPPDFAVCHAVGVYRGVHPSKVDELLTTLAERPGIEMGDYEETPTAPNCVEVRVNLMYGPVLGAWPADIRRQMHNARNLTGTVAQLLLEDEDRSILATRAEYDALVASEGKAHARAHFSREL